MGYIIILLSLLVSLMACTAQTQPDITPTSTPTPQSLAVSNPNFEKGVLPKVISTTSRLKNVRTEGSYPALNNSLILIAGGNPQEEEIPFLEVLDSSGKSLKTFEFPNKQGGVIGDRRLLPNKNILFTMTLDGIYEIDWEGNIVWYLFDDTVSHHAELLSNGHLLTAGLGCDCVKEIDYNTKETLWFWDAHSAFAEYNANTYKGMDAWPGGINIFNSKIFSNAIFPYDWTHINYVQWLPKTDTFLISLRNFNTIIEVNRAGKIIWSFGPGILKLQHYPYAAPDNTITIFDNGNGRVIRINREQKILFEYNNLVSPFLGDTKYLPDGNYKILQATAFENYGGESDLRIVSPEDQILWRMYFGTENIYRADILYEEEMVKN